MFSAKSPMTEPRNGRRPSPSADSVSVPQETLPTGGGILHTRPNTIAAAGLPQRSRRTAAKDVSRLAAAGVEGEPLGYLERVGNRRSVEKIGPPLGGSD